MKLQEIKDIVKSYPNVKSSELAEKYDVPLSTIYKTAQRYNVKKSAAFLNSCKSGRIQPGQHLSPETELKKGNKCATKGKRIESIIKNKEKLKHWREKCLWKKGHKPYNTAKNGEIRWRKNPGYFFIRIEENNWEFYHRYLWRNHKGDIPEGFNIIFKDGNSRNCKIQNLECISNAELAERNRDSKYPEDVRKAIRLKNKLTKQIKQYESSN